jgi:hypothetical protein
MKSTHPGVLAHGANSIFLDSNGCGAANKSFRLSFFTDRALPCVLPALLDRCLLINSVILERHHISLPRLPDKLTV